VLGSTSVAPRSRLDNLNVEKDQGKERVAAC